METGKKSSLNLSHAACILFYEVFRSVKEREGKFREIPEQSTRAFKPLSFAAKQRLKDLLLQSRRLLDVGAGDNGAGGDAEDGDEEDRNEANLKSLVAKNSLSAKDATVLFHLAQRVVALGHLHFGGKDGPSSSLLGPALEEALRKEAGNAGQMISEAEMKALVKKGEQPSQFFASVIEFLSSLASLRLSNIDTRSPIFSIFLSHARMQWRPRCLSPKRSFGISQRP